MLRVAGQDPAQRAGADRQVIGDAGPALEAAGLSSKGRGALTVVPAVGYLESLALTRGARLVITDSGGVQREAYWLGVPCITLRQETEWTETLALRANHLMPPDDVADALPALASSKLSDGSAAWDRTAYGSGDAAARIAGAVMALSHGRGIGAADPGRS